MESRIVIAMYKPHAGKEQELLGLVEQHIPTLRKLELITDRPAVLCKSEDGTLLEIFEWVSEKSSAQAHQHPEVAMVWEKMGAIADFPGLADLTEAKKRFPHFLPLS